MVGLKSRGVSPPKSINLVYIRRRDCESAGGEMRGYNTAIFAVVGGGIVAGTVDIAAACLINWLGPLFILHAIASGALGREAAFSGGATTALIGGALQLAMSVLIAAIYYLGAVFFPMLKRQWFSAGLAFGVVVFFVMNYIVVPLSALHRVPHFTPLSFALNMFAMLLFGAIIAGFARDDAWA